MNVCNNTRLYGGRHNIGNIAHDLVINGSQWCFRHLFCISTCISVNTMHIH